MPDVAVRLLFAECGRCGGQVVGDSMTSRPWQHLDRPDDHLIIFGTPAPADVINGHTALEVLEGLLEEEGDVAAGLPAGGRPRRAVVEEVGDSNRAGTRQVLNLATKQGFATELSICRGPVKSPVHIDEAGYRLVDSLLVGFRHDDGRRAIAVWERRVERDEAFEFRFAFFPTGSGCMSSSELKAYLREPASVD